MADDTIPPANVDKKPAASRTRQAAYMIVWREKNKEHVRAYRADPANKARKNKLRRAKCVSDPKKWAELSLEDREKAKIAQREWKARLSPEKREYYREKERLRSALRYATEMTAEKHTKLRIAHAKWKAGLTPEQKEYQALRYRAKEAKRRAVQESRGHHTAQDIRDIFALQRAKCGACRCSIRKGYHVDHIIAIANGGSNDRRNIQLLCEPCNLLKKAKDPIEFMRELGRLL